MGSGIRFGVRLGLGLDLVWGSKGLGGLRGWSKGWCGSIGLKHQISSGSNGSRGVVVGGLLMSSRKVW